MTKHIFRIGLFSLLYTLIFLTNASAHTSGGIAVEHAWVREAPPNTKVLAAYLEIQNHTAKKRSISAITSKQFDKIEIHLSTNIDGVAKMKAIKNVDIPAEGKVVFSPGGLHIMLMGAKTPLHEGNIVNLNFHFKDGSNFATDVSVKKAKSKESHDHGNTDHSEHMQHKH